MKYSSAFFAFLFLMNISQAQKLKTYTAQSPDNSLVLKVETDNTLRWSLLKNGHTVIEPSPIALQLQGGETLGNNAVVLDARKEAVNNTVQGIHYKKSIVPDVYNQLTLKCKGFTVLFRLYNAGAAYRFITNRKDSVVVEDEIATFNFRSDRMAYIPYVNSPLANDIYECSFENTYSHINLSSFVKDTLAFAPVLVELDSNYKAVITEADLEDYPGMFLQARGGKELIGKYAPYALKQQQGGYNNLQAYVTEHAPYIAHTNGTRNFPWRVVVVSKQDKELLNNDLVYLLASPSRVEDMTWIKPGKVAWDWWNNWNISHVPFKAGINTETYKYYIDFAAANHIEYILLDEGWASSTDIMKIVPAINLREIIAYGKSKNVGVWLWGGWLPLDQKIDEALSYYSQLGIAGFKIDFMNRDDQQMVRFYYRMAAKAAQYHLMIDYHGAYKPTGLQRTYPNVMNFEGVHGMEQLKWSNPDMPLYDATIPFIRQIAGPMDYTPGAMVNANKDEFKPIWSNPMSQGTRCHQLAMYVVFDAPFEMLADNPTRYMKEPESVDFISHIPTVYDETIALNGKVGAYAATARKAGDTWYIGVLGNWNAQDVELDLSFLPEGNYTAEVWKDGVNADRDATDFVQEKLQVNSSNKLTVHLSNGGGWVARIKKN